MRFLVAIKLSIVIIIESYEKIIKRLGRATELQDITSCEQM